MEELLQVAGRSRPAATKRARAHKALSDSEGDGEQGELAQVKQLAIVDKLLCSWGSIVGLRNSPC